MSTDNVERLHAVVPIEHLILEGETVIIDRDRPGILVGRYLPWSDLPAIMAHRHCLVPSSLLPPAEGTQTRGRRKHLGLLK